eukprot:gene2372-2677_t
MAEVSLQVQQLLWLVKDRVGAESAARLKKHLASQLRCATAAAKAAGRPVDVASYLQQLLPGLQKDVESACRQASRTSTAAVVIGGGSSAAAAAWQQEAAESAGPQVTAVAGPSRSARPMTAASCLSTSQVRLQGVNAPTGPLTPGAVHVSDLPANMVHNISCSDNQQGQSWQPVTAMMDLLPTTAAFLEPAGHSVHGHQQHWGASPWIEDAAAWMELQEWQQQLGAITGSPGSMVTAADVEALLQAELAAVMLQYEREWQAGDQPAGADL